MEIYYTDEYLLDNKEQIEESVKSFFEAQYSDGEQEQIHLTNVEINFSVTTKVREIEE